MSLVGQGIAQEMPPCSWPLMRVGGGVISAWYPAFLSLPEIHTSMVAHLVCHHTFVVFNVQGLSCDMALQLRVQWEWLSGCCSWDHQNCQNLPDRLLSQQLFPLLRSFLGG